MVREHAVSLLVIMRVVLLLCICIFWEGEAFFQDECVGLYWIVLVCFVEVMSAY
jgi:hypothetical protein